MSDESYCLSELHGAKKNSLVVSVYCCEDDSDAHLTGYVLDATDKGITLQHLTPDGEPDGKVLIPMSCVFRVDVDGRYERKIAFLAKHYDQVFS